MNHIFKYTLLIGVLCCSLGCDEPSPEPTRPHLPSVEDGLLPDNLFVDIKWLKLYMGLGEFTLSGVTNTYSRYFYGVTNPQGEDNHAYLWNWSFGGRGLQKITRLFRNWLGKDGKDTYLEPNGSCTTRRGLPCIRLNFWKTNQDSPRYSFELVYHRKAWRLLTMTIRMKLIDHEEPFCTPEVSPTEDQFPTRPPCSIPDDLVPQDLQSELENYSRQAYDVSSTEKLQYCDKILNPYESLEKFRPVFIHCASGYVAPSQHAPGYRRVFLHVELIPEDLGKPRKGHIWDPNSLSYVKAFMPGLP